MNVPLWLWLVTIGGLTAIILADLFLVDHRPHAVTISEATRWVLFYVALAGLFGLGVWFFAGGGYAGEFVAGYITEYSLSVDNLFVFVIIMSSFKVPVIHQHRVLLVGIVIALIMRGLFIAVGAAAIDHFSWVFFLFAAFLIYTAVNMIRQSIGNEEEEWREPRVVGLLRRILPVSEDYHGAKPVVRHGAKLLVTPMLVVMVTIGVTDLLFALDSIPAIFGLTQEPYLVFTANAFALMGLRQLYFLLGGLLEKLVFLSYGLAVILGFIGLKLVLEALHENELPFVNGGEPVSVPDIGIALSLGVIVGVLAMTTIASLIAVRRNPALAAGNAPAPGRKPAPAPSSPSVPASPSGPRVDDDASKAGGMPQENGASQVNGVSRIDGMPKVNGASQVNGLRLNDAPVDRSPQVNEVSRVNGSQADAPDGAARHR